MIEELLDMELSNTKNRQSYWYDFYTKERFFLPSQFSQWFINNYLGFLPKNYYDTKLTLLDWCSGNGRDSYYLASKFEVLGVDYAIQPLDNERVRFIRISIETFMNNNPCAYDIVYSRFSLHAVEEKIENQLLKWCKNLLVIEVRSDKGISELTQDHYRRLCNYEKFQNKLLDNGFKILYQIESRGLAVQNEEDPIIIRIVALSSRSKWMENCKI